MKAVIINGSPKGDHSITLQTALYGLKNRENIEQEIIHAGKYICKYEKDFSEARKILMSADLIIFSYPVYTFLAPSQLHRFIRLTKESGTDLSGKYAVQITTSKHFYDITACRYISDNCADMRLKYIGALSADMDDLLTEKGRKEAADFIDYALFAMSKDLYENPSVTAYAGEFVPVKTTACEPTDKRDKRVVIVADIKSAGSSLSGMAERFRARLPYKTSLININDFKFAGGCISCFKCASDGQCIYRDGFQELLRDDIQKADAVVIAFEISDHSMGCNFKTYDDRQFCNGHRTVTMGTPFAYLVSGRLSEEENLRTVIEARAQVGGNMLCGVATDEENPDGEIEKVVSKLVYAIENKYRQPSNFYGVGGMKIFRDLIWLMRGLMKADHRFFKAHGQYDFPQKKKATALKMFIVGGLMSNKKIMSKMGNKLYDGMIAPYKKALDK